MPLLNFQIGPFRFRSGKKLPDALKRECARPFIVTDQGLRNAGCWSELPILLMTVFSCIFDDTPGNPTEDAVSKALEVCRGNDCDGVVCVGGGSPMDLGKAVALLAVSGGPLAQYDPLQG